jgi:hypothetical protein
MIKTPNLSKSSFGAGMQCHKRLWIEKRQSELVPAASASQQAIFDQGHEVGSWSHRLFPEGILLSGEMDFKAHLQASRDALATRKPLFEPAFSIPGAYHHEYLAEGIGDPRPGFLQALQACIGREGSIVTYNSGFETGRLRELATQFPDHAAWINQALARFENADLLQPFRSFAPYHPSQHGSASIKDVLPAFTDLSYDDLTIQEGGTASNQFLNLLRGLVPAMEVASFRENLLRYCERDTLAMVELVEKLRLLVGA